MNKYKVVSLFSGSGGLDLGFINSNKFEIIFANDFNKQAVETYKVNIGDHVVCDDIANLISVPQAEVLVGGPPCQGFSTANPNRSFDDPRNHLFKEYSRILSIVNPKIFVMENVSGMLTMQKGKVLEIILNELENQGYNVKYKILNSKDFGAPQSRRRVILVGVRKDITINYKYPEVLYNDSNYVTVGKVLLENPMPKGVKNHDIGKLTELNLRRLQYIPEGGSMKNCPLELQNNSDLKRAMRRLNSNDVSYTIVHNNCDHYYHPIENRRITIREMARLQGYPDSFEFIGSKSEQSRQVGNSVPIKLAEAIAQSVSYLLNQL
ncbi:DNA cytosine methyltransferase [Sphingobacterium spiritivorum]|uniref:DNA cytosine methyltransferase n=1 Tax=Sphingobacterium spiritivorum TaxID=258 RepID=UPI003DA26694